MCDYNVTRKISSFIFFNSRLALEKQWDFPIDKRALNHRYAGLIADTVELGAVNEMPRNHK